MRRLISRRLNIISRLESEAEALRLELSEAKERFRGLADEYVTLGWQCMADGNDPAPAIANYDKALRICPGHTEALLAKGRLLAAGGDYDNAEQCLRQAADNDNSDWRALAALADIYIGSMAYAEALDCLLLAVERQPKTVQLHDTLASLYETIDSPEDAEIHRAVAAQLRKRRKKKK